ncbi:MULTISPECIES: GNAT family N-acetyltransferase [unclassified Roseitalea]|uniref:GNAT family N-acetyltransferase n=1 Tax=unclassified Roseitalea TaxID=2639107 RepID=UPI00273DA393|nr:MULTISPECIES: GNAT family N-acetyltransferase [unclassified Roseitalea]
MTTGIAASSSARAETRLLVRVHERVADVPADVWAGFSGAARGGSTPYNPFVSHAFLSALEESGSAVAGTGWHGKHLVLEDAQGKALAAMPAFLKSHSQGEYVFDHGWADAFERAGGRYYPKLQSSVPFTPATGPRLLVGPDVDAAAARRALARAMAQLTERLGLSSAHVTFARQADIDALVETGFLHRTDQQFHFRNQGYSSYGAFLETLSSRKRKNLKKERATALENGIEIDWLTGSDITEAALDAFFAFYVDTGSRKWGRPYLNRTFFSLVAERMAQDILLVMARRNGRYIAGAINFIGEDTIFGRHWGCIEHHRFLHFEVCYHQAIDFAIDRGLEVVEAGAQGEHKIARGYMPVTTHSAHYLPHEGFRDAVADYLRHERADVARFGEILSGAGPFKKSG